MQKTTDRHLQILVLMFLVIVPCCGASASAPTSLEEQLQAQYTVTEGRVGPAGLTVTEEGIVLVIKKAGVVGVPPEGAAMPTSIYKNGALHKPSFGSDFGASMLRGAANPSSDTNGKDDRPLPVGDKVYISRIDVNMKNERIIFRVIECDPCNGTNEPSSYKAQIAFQFGKGYLESAAVPEVEDTISQVFAIDAPAPEIAATPAVAQPQEPVPAQGPEAPALTNDDIIKLVQLKLGDSVIIAKIKSSACAFNTSIDGLGKLKQAGASDAVLQAMIEAGGSAAEPPAPSPPTEPAAAAAPPPPAGCADYQSCLQGGADALKGYNWSLALSDFQAASTMDASKPDAWAGMGRADLAIGQYSEASAMWDNALARGGTIEFNAWYFKPTHLDIGTFHMGAHEVSFILPNQEKVFLVAPAEPSSLKSHHPPLARNAWSFGMKIEGHNYWFSMVPLGVECRNPNICADPAAYGEEEAVSNYVARTIPKLASGTLAQLAPSAPPVQSSMAKPVDAPPSASAPPATVQMGQTPDQVKAILGQPQKIDDQGAKQIYVFKDMKVIFVDGKVSDVE
ncbi:MAG TPA: hypothetical protein VG028_20605 [Terriglobia bacterium]|nr:hypothetical protein [Terriglobia bacterium]